MDAMREEIKMLRETAYGRHIENRKQRQKELEESEQRIREHINEVYSLRFDSLTNDDLLNLSGGRISVGRDRKENDRIVRYASRELDNRLSVYETDGEELARGILEHTLVPELNHDADLMSHKIASIKILEKIAKDRGWV